MPFVSSGSAPVNHHRQGREEEDKKRNGPGHHVMACPSRPAFGLATDLARRRGGLLLGSRGVGPLSSGAATRRRGDALTSAGATTTVRSSQRTSLRTRSRMRATTFMHFAVPPPDVPAPAGPADRAAASRGRFQLGVEVRLSKETPGSGCACGGNPPPDQSGTSCPSAACHKSNTQDRMQQGAGNDSSAPRSQRRTRWHELCRVCLRSKSVSAART